MKAFPTLATCALAMAANSILRADNFGTTGNEFTIEFVSIGNPGNADDAGAGGGLYSTPFGGVAYNFRMGTYEISQDAINKATSSGLLNVTAGAWASNQPAADISWYQAAAFVNFLNTSSGHQAAYDLTFSGSWSMNLWSSGQAWQIGGENLYRHKDAFYFLPSEDEWYKAAYHKNDGVTANYWDYATASNSAPTPVSSGTATGTAVYDGGAIVSPASVASAGGLSAYGTMAQNGNVWEWQESAVSGSNTDPAAVRSIRGNYWGGGEPSLRSEFQGDQGPDGPSTHLGFRVASVPEPTAVTLLLGSGMLLLLRRTRQKAK